MLDPKIFRAYDIRGVADEDFNDESVHALGQAFGGMVKDRGGQTVSVGHDCRLSGPRIFDAFCGGLMSAGVDVFGIGAVATPLAYFSETHLDANAAVSITGSHNPSNWNGFKFTINKGALFGEDIQEIRSRATSASGHSARGNLTNVSIAEAYIDYALSTLRPMTREVTVICDAGSGMAGPIAPTLYEQMGATVIPLFCETDGRFPYHHPDPTEEENLADLREALQSSKADIGLAFDGDADRLGAVNHDQRIIWGDQLMLLFAQSILKEQPRAKFLAEVKCSDVLFSRIAELGGSIEMGKVGHSLIKARMKETGAILAGEMSGHLFFKDRYLGYDDGIYAGARLVELLGSESFDLNNFLASLPKTVATPEIRIPCDDHRKFEVVEAAKNILRPRYDLVEIDGLRLRTDKGWALLRASNTQPALVMRVEATDAKALASIQSIVESTLKEIMHDRA